LIYSGAITTWSDPILMIGDPTTASDDNPGLAGCGLGIDVAKREDIATSTNVLKEYLAIANPMFNGLKAKELTQVWPPTLPTGCRAIGDAGMSTCLATPGTLGHVLYQEAYSKTNYKMAELQNIGGGFAAPATNVSATPARTTYPDNCYSAAAASASSLPPTQIDWSRVTLTNTTSGYPLCQFSYLLGYSRPEAAMAGVGPGQVRTMVDYLTDIARDDVQEGLKTRQVSPLPPAIRTLLRIGITNISP
ncbi:MAG TPA: substrate-binding domain-containing protein, partial [Actinomycetota bacterium]|nr:substrate-binding domain-containing protein [Actinomycetota bacterium]